MGSGAICTKASHRDKLTHPYFNELDDWCDTVSYRGLCDQTVTFGTERASNETMPNSLELARTLPATTGRPPYIHPYVSPRDPEAVLAAWAIEGGGAELIECVERMVRPSRCPRCSGHGYLIAMMNPPSFTVDCPSCT